MHVIVPKANLTLCSSTGMAAVAIAIALTLIHIARTLVICFFSFFLPITNITETKLISGSTPTAR